jgi:hypothetical protein
MMFNLLWLVVEVEVDSTVVVEVVEVDTVVLLT